MFNPEELMKEYEKLNKGRSKLAGIRYAIEQADLAKDYGYMLYFRYVYADTCGGYEDGLLRHIYYVFPEMLKIFKEHPDIEMPHSCYMTAQNAVWTVFLWLVDMSDLFYQVPLLDIEKYFDEFKNFSLEYGHDLQSYYIASARFYRDFDKDRAWKSFEAFREYNKARQIKNPETIAFECEMEVYFGNIDKALSILKPLMEGEYHDDYRLYYEYNRIFYHYLINEQDMEKAQLYYKLVEDLRKKLHIAPILFDAYVLYLVFTDMDAAWNYYKKEAPSQAESTIPMSTLIFATASVIIMKYLLKHGRDQVHLRFSNKLPYYRKNGCYQTKELAAYFDREATDLSEKFDARNGNHENIEDYKLTLKAAKLLDEATGQLIKD